MLQSLRVGPENLPTVRLEEYWFHPPAVVVEESLDRKHSDSSAVTWREVEVGSVSCLPAEDGPELSLRQPRVQVEEAGVEGGEDLPDLLVSLVHGQEVEERPGGGGPPLETDDPESEEDLQDPLSVHPPDRLPHLRPQPGQDLALGGVTGPGTATSRADRQPAGATGSEDRLPLRGYRE